MSDELPTKERLALAIALRLGARYDPRVDRLIRLARNGHYDDYESDLAGPTIQLVEDLRAVGFDDLAQRVIDGDFDGTSTESEAWMQKEGWAHLLGSPLSLPKGDQMQRPDTDHFTISAANPTTVKALCDHLIAAYEQFIASHPDNSAFSRPCPSRTGKSEAVRFVDGFMGCHNFYKAIILDLEQRMGTPPGMTPDWLRRAAVDTLRQTLLGEQEH